MNTFYKLPYKKTGLESKRKFDLIVGYEYTDNRKTPLNVVYLTKEKPPSDLDDDELDKYEEEHSFIKIDNDKIKLQFIDSKKEN